MDEIEYKLNTNNSVLVVNAIDKLISVIKSKYKPVEHQKFVLENEELKFLRDKCSSKDNMVSLTACQGLLALVELGVLEIGHTMSTVVTLLPSAHNYSAIISTMAGLLTLDLKSRLVPGQPYTCQFTLRSPQHPFITVLERNRAAQDDVIAQMHALCTHPDYTISSNSLELLRPVFLWLTCSDGCEASLKPWQLLLHLPQSSALNSLLLACVCCQQICNPKQIDRAFAAYSAVTEAAIYQQNREYVSALVPMLARVSNELIKHGRDPRACYNLIERCFSLDEPSLRSYASLTLALLAENLSTSCALYLHELFNLCLNIISKYEYSSLSLCTFTALSLQWLHLPSYLTSSALKISSKILEIYQNEGKEDTRLHMANLKSNKTFMTLLHTDSHLSLIFKLNKSWERIRDNRDELKSWFDSLEMIKDDVLLELLPFLLGIILLKRKEPWFEEYVVRSIRIATGLVSLKKEVSVNLMPVLLYKIASDSSPVLKMECMKALPLMAKTKENVPTIVSVLNKLNANKGAPTSFLIMLYTTLAETQVRCFPYLQEMLAEASTGRPDDLKWEVNIARAMAVKRICEIRASTLGLELVSVISSILNKCTDKAGAVAASLALQALVFLWRGAAVAPPSTWRALEPKLGRDSRPALQLSLCGLLSEIPSLRVATPEYDRLVADTSRKLWAHVAESTPEVVAAACDALSRYKIDDYTLKDIPEIYRRTVKLPASFCKSPADAARKPEDVLDYIPCEIWPEVFKYTNQAALPSVVTFVSRLVDREIRSYRSGVYQRDARVEPPNVNYLPPNSVVRGLMECFRRQATTPSYDYPDAVLLSIADALTHDYPKPLPPLDLTFLPELFHRGSAWKERSAKLAARQAATSGSARRLLENYLQGVVTGCAEEVDINLIFDLLPILCRGMPPNTLRPVIEKCLADAYADIVNVKATTNNSIKKDSEDQKYQFIRQMEKIKDCLECEKIHDANRTLLSQIVENYFTIIKDDNVAWETYIETCTCLSTKYLERMTSPSSWWEVTSELVRAAGALRCKVAAQADCTKPLVWLNEIIDVQATQITEQDYSLQCMLPALKAANADDDNTRDWFLQLMARTQVAFNETEDESAKLYLCDVFMLSVIVFSGHCHLDPNSEYVSSRAVRQSLLPAAAAALMRRQVWSPCTLQMLEWLSHTMLTSRDVATALCCRRALITLRHTDAFRAHHMWKRLENHLGKNTAVDD